MGINISAEKLAALHDMGYTPEKIIASLGHKACVEEEAPQDQEETPEDKDYWNNVAAEAACISAEEQAAANAQNMGLAQSAQQDKEKAEVQEPEEMD